MVTEKRVGVSNGLDSLLTARPLGFEEILGLPITWVSILERGASHVWLGIFVGRSRLLDRMTIRLHEEIVVGPRFGHYAKHDHVAVNADIGAVDVPWIAEHDPCINSMGSKGIGEIGLVGTAAAIASAVHHATGIRVRDLLITPNKLLQ